MLLIVLGHIIMVHHDANETEYIISHFTRPFSIVAVNVFILISGYFGIRFKTYRLVQLSCQTWFYSVAIFLLVVALGLHTINVRVDILAFLPIFSKQYWFITAYFVLYCIAPFINHAIENTNHHIFQKGLFVGFLLFYIWPTLCYLVNTNQLVLDAGYGIVNFIYLYIFGRYIRLFHTETKTPQFYLTIYVASSVLLFFFQYALSHFLGFEFSSWLSYNTLFVFVAAIALFMFFKNLNFHSHIVNVLAAPCLAVYLVHLSPYGWKQIIQVLQIEESRGLIYILMLVSYPIIIYAFGFCIERIRLFLFQWYEKLLCKWIEQFINKHLYKNIENSLPKKRL
ncbi:MAG: hypothetical protein IJ693_01800 [Bacteroidaceae bacterium]|nr:hypothetical protein [Bacteroidaceae bacterium]